MMWLLLQTIERLSKLRIKYPRRLKIPFDVAQHVGFPVKSHSFRYVVNILRISHLINVKIWKTSLFSFLFLGGGVREILRMYYQARFNKAREKFGGKFHTCQLLKVLVICVNS
jgi:hypothetical protein